MREVKIIGIWTHRVGISRQKYLQERKYRRRSERSEHYGNTAGSLWRARIFTGTVYADSRNGTSGPRTMSQRRFATDSV
jgi:hypothetical protein